MPRTRCVNPRRFLITLMATVALCFGAGSVCFAQDDDAAETPPPTTSAAVTDSEAPASAAATKADESNEAAASENKAETAELSPGEAIDAWFGEKLVAPIAGLMFAELFQIPFIVLMLVCGCIFFTLRYNFINVRMFKHAIDCVRGRYDKPDDHGEISHFKALTSALSATVGLGNIAGVAIAIGIGGPGAVFWMWAVAFCGMTLKLASCTLAQLYRRVRVDGSVLGGPMVYLRDGIADRWPNLRHFGEFLGSFYAFCIILASIGGGNMFQGNASYAIFIEVFPGTEGQFTQWTMGILFSVFTGIVIIGGIKRIGEVTSKLVPFMCLIYVITCMTIIIANIPAVPGLLWTIVHDAFNPDSAIVGGAVAVLVQGMKRAAFSNEAGLGSAAIAHAAAKTDEPAREGIVASIGPVIDTIVVCTMTALTILISGVYEPGIELDNTQAVALTSAALGTVHTSLQYIILIVVLVFAYSTLISWSYYGEKGTEFLFGEKGKVPYRIIYVVIACLGPVLSAGNVITFSELMILALAFPNIIGLLFLSNRLGGVLKDYTTRLKNGDIKPLK